MSLSPKLEVRQSQNLVMTPQLQQAIKLLQLSNLDLMSYVEQEVEQNPMLEQADPNQPERGDGPDIDHQPEESSDSDSESAGDGDGADKAAEGGLEAEQVVPDAADFSDEANLPQENEAPLDVDLNEAIGSEPAEPGYASDAATIDGFGPSHGGRSDFSDSGYSLEQNTSEGLSLTGHLLEQLNVDVEDAVETRFKDGGGQPLGHEVELETHLAAELDVQERVACRVKFGLVVYGLHVRPQCQPSPARRPIKAGLPGPRGRRAPPRRRRAYRNGRRCFRRGPGCDCR